jgi:hypothetical protein
VTVSKPSPFDISPKQDQKAGWNCHLEKKNPEERSARHTAERSSGTIVDQKSEAVGSQLNGDTQMLLMGQSLLTTGPIIAGSTWFNKPILCAELQCRNVLICL